MSKRILAWSDSASAGTGYGIISREVLRALHGAGYQIDQLGINYNGEFYDRSEIPWHISPARLLDPSDPHGALTFVEHVRSGKYDLLWLQNDPVVWQPLVPRVQDALAELRRRLIKPPLIIAYYPVDGRLFTESLAMLELADAPVVYSEFGRRETLKLLPQLQQKLRVIPPGINLEAFKTLPPAERREIRRRYFDIASDETFLILNVNRNTPRKQLAHTILAFQALRRELPDSKLYLHTPIRDNFSKIDLSFAVRDLGLSMTSDVIFPANFSQARPIPVATLNQIYNAADCFLTTSTGEGWGLTTIEAMAVRLPVVAPENTVFPEQLTKPARGYLYPAVEQVYIDNSGFRCLGRVYDVVETVMKLVQQKRSSTEFGELLDNARSYAETLCWKNIVERWLALFADLTC